MPVQGRQKCLPFLFYANYSFLVLRIHQMFLIDVIQNMIQIVCRDILRHPQIHIEVVSAVSGGGSRNLAFKVTDKLKKLCYERDDVFRLVIPGQEQVETGAAAHGAEIEDTGAVLRVIS